MVKASVIIPTFNCRAYIEETILSVTRQTEPNLEIIVIDDGSTDDTLEVVKRLACADRRVLVHSLPRTRFPGAVRNRGLDGAKGDYICFLDGDDLYHPDKIRKSVTFLDSLIQADLLFHDFVPFSSSLDGMPSFMKDRRFHSLATSYLREVGPGRYICLKDFYVFMSLQFVPFHISSVMLRRSLLDSGAVWFREDISPGEDGDLWLRLAKEHRMAFLDEPLSYYRQRPGSVTSDRIRTIRASVEINMDNLERGADTFTKREVSLYRSKIARQLFELGYEFFQQQKISYSRAAYWRSMRLRLSLRTLAAYLKTFAPKTVVERLRRPSINA